MTMNAFMHEESEFRVTHHIPVAPHASTNVAMMYKARGPGAIAASSAPALSSVLMRKAGANIGTRGQETVSSKIQAALFKYYGDKNTSSRGNARWSLCQVTVFSFQTMPYEMEVKTESWFKEFVDATLRTVPSWRHRIPGGCLDQRQRERGGTRGFFCDAGIKDATNDVAAVEEILDKSYHMQKIADTPGCPIALERVDMRGLLLLMRMGDYDEMIYSDAAQMIASTVDRLLPHAKAAVEKQQEPANSADFEEFGIGFSQFLKKCTPSMYIDGVP
ncbi:hypothetical protein CPB85DRAFT_1256234 [Mucidula mucida]|nr:hypothetical protein CPB85DRAFT_1256234 [Mucidula mucida]